MSFFDLWDAGKALAPRRAKRAARAFVVTTILVLGAVAAQGPAFAADASKAALRWSWNTYVGFIEARVNERVDKLKEQLPQPQPVTPAPDPAAP